MPFRVDCIASIDANFTQKRRRGKTTDITQAFFEHPETVFIPREDVAVVEKFVETIRPQQKKDVKGKGKAPAADEPDGFEPGMRVPSSVLAECGESFTAADEKRQKASTQFFADTGLMALLCRHDRVLWLVNMTSAGEKQFYVLALVKHFFEHLPPSVRVGLLYDIGCQLHRSCVKWGFLREYMDRIVFAISVFHAYGHQWPCQIIYHPRKCVGFGFSDGEGCERFWSAIKQLIPSLRVSGYHYRLYTIDTQVKHLDQKSLENLGSWLHRKWVLTQNRKNAAERDLVELKEIGITERLLRDEWAAQVKEQTRPNLRQSKNAADKVIGEILGLKQSLNTYVRQAHDLELMLESGQYGSYMDALEVQLQVEELNEKCARLKKAMSQKKGSLGVDGRLNLERLMGDNFLRNRVNALALKKRIRNRLCQRKFELEALERVYRKTINGMLI